MDTGNKVDILDLDGNNGCEHCENAGRGEFFSLFRPSLSCITGKMTVKCKHCGNIVRPSRKAVRAIAFIRAVIFTMSYFLVACCAGIFRRLGIPTGWSGLLQAVCAALVFVLICEPVPVLVLARCKWVNAPVRVEEDIKNELSAVKLKYLKVLVIVSLAALAVMYFFVR